MALKRRDTGEVITFGGGNSASSKRGSGWNANDQAFYGNNLTLRKVAQKGVVVNASKAEKERKKRLEALRKQYQVGDTSAENKAILRQIRETAGIKPNVVQRTADTLSGATKSYGAQLTNTGGSFLELLSSLDDAAFQAEYGDRYKAAQRSQEYWAKMLAEAQTEEERKRAETGLSVAQNAMSSIEGFRAKSGSEVESAAQKLYGKADELELLAAEDVSRAKEGLGSVGQTLVDLGVGGSQLAADIGFGVLTGGGSMLPTALRVYGGSTQQARQAGASFGEQLAYGASSAALAVATESLSSVATPLKKAFGSGVADDVIKKLAGKMNNSVAGRTLIAALAEGGEELAEALADPLLQRLTYDENAKYSAETLSDAAYSFLLGAVLGGGVGAVGEVADARTARNLYEGSERDLVEESLSLDAKNRTAKNAQKRLDAGKALSGVTLNNLVRQNENVIRQNGEREEAEPTEEDNVRELMATLTDENATDDAKAAASDAWLGYQVSAEETEARRKRAAEAKRTAVSPIAHNTEFTEEEARYIVEEGAKEFGNAASSVVNSYMRGQDPQMYMAQARLVFNYGKTMSEEKGIPYALNSPLLKSMDETQIRSLFNAGRMQAKAIPVTAVKGKGEVVLTGGIDYSLLGEARQKQVNALSSFAKATGYTIELFESTANEEGKYTAELGSFDPSTGVIRIDINAGRDKVDDLTNYAMVRVASHEITHSFKKNAPQQYVALRDYVTGILADKGRFDDLVDTKMRELGLDHETAVDEVVADGCEMMLRDTRFINNLAKEDRTLFEKIRDAIRKFVKKIREAFEGVEIAHEEAQLLKDAENLQKLWDEALAKSVENVAAAEAATTESSGEKMLSTRDSEYMEAVRNGDMEAAQRMVDEAARAAGYTIEAYHGTNAEFFTFEKGRVGKGQDVYGSGFYFASDRDAAEAYGKRIIPSRLKLENPYRVIARPTGGGLRDIKLTQKQAYEILKRHPKIRAEDSPLGDFYEEFWEHGTKDWMIRGLARQYTDLQTLEGDLFRDYPNELHEAIRDVTGHDGIEVRFQVDESGFMPEDYWFYVAWFDNQMKSAEPVVRDDAGEVIPLSQRFDESQSDIRYSKRDYSYAALTSKLDMTVTAVQEEARYDRKTVVENALKSAASVGRRTENGNAVIKVRDIGRDVVVTKRSLVHGLDRRLNVQAPVLENVGSVLQNAIRINELTPRRDDVESTYVLVGAARGTKGMYIASFVVNSITDEVTTVDVFYALNAKKESAALLPKFTDESATPTDSVISVANLLDYVNQYFPDILPEDVLKHYGHDERPAGKLGADALFSFRAGYIPTDRSILASYVPTDSDSDMVKRHIAEYQQNVQQLRDLEQTLREHREQMRSLTGDGNKKQRAALRDEIIKTQNRIQIASDQLLRKEKWMGVRTVLNREKDALVKQAKAEENEKLKKYRAQRWDTENRRKLRERISYRVKTLDKMLREPTDDKHIPEAMREMVFDFCEVFTYESGVFSGKKLRQMQAVYTFLKKPDSSGSLADLYDEDIEDMMKYLADTMEGKRLSELDMEQLSMVKAIADHFAFMVKNENEIFVHGRKVKLDETAQGVIAAAKEHKQLTPEIAKGEALDAFEKFLTSGNLRPVYFFRDKGSDMDGLFQSLLDAQSEYAFRMDEAMHFAEETEKATGYSEWGDSEKTLTFTNSANQQVTLNLQQAMSLLATYERELQSGNLLHVTQGGFLYEKDVTGDITVKGVKVPVIKQVVQAEKAKAHPMSAEDMDKVRTWLGEIDPRVLDYMGKMVEYLSTTMADYGNETSMQLHGYKKFGESYYWPIKSAEEFLQQEPGKAGFDESRWKHKGFTKATVKGANNPFVLRGFAEVWSNHVSQMCMYSTMAVPQDAFVRVMNYKTQVDPTGSTASESVKSEIRSNYGQKALAYIDTYLSDINGGLLTDPRAGALNRLVSLFKKNAVFGSASVALQQYSAVIRAMVYLDPKYFVRNAGWKKTQEAFERAKQYSGVAIIKEIGGFDTTTGRSGANWLMERDPTELKDKAKALFQFGEKDTGYRDRLLTALPAKMDKVGWGHIWIAAENEIADTTDLERGTDAFYEAVAERFEKVIELTQVYDSVLTRSENMRGKDGLIKAATSFMAEPTVTMNMFVTAAQDAIAGKGGAKARLAKTAFVLAMSVIVNNILKALATAGRDKDEDQTIVEKYVEDVVGGIISDVNPFGYVPILRDVKSIWEGYSVEASYAAVVSDVYDAWTKWEKNQAVESGFDVLNAVAALFGIPAKNLKRDIMAVLDTFLETAPLSESSKRGFWNATREGLGIMPGVDDKMMEAFEADRKGNEKARKKALDEITRLYEDKAKQYRLEGKEDAAKKAKSSLKSTITSVLKPLYQAAKTQTEKNRIKSLALRVYVGGEQLYNGYDFERYWGED